MKFPFPSILFAVLRFASMLEMVRRIGITRLLNESK